MRDTAQRRIPYQRGRVITSHAVRRLLGLLYLAGLLLLADQVADLAATLLAKPWLPSEATWRFGAFGLLLTRASVFLLADVMLFTAAIWLGHRKVLRSLGLLHLLVAVLLAAGLGTFVLDWLQVRSQLPEDGRRSFDLAGLRAAGLAAMALGLSTWAGLVSLRATRARKHHDREGAASPLLTRSGRTRAAHD
jgi:uncharacterized membrane protein YwzB